jgi:hypothetical protein
MRVFEGMCALKVLSEIAGAARGFSVRRNRETGQHETGFEVYADGRPSELGSQGR